MSTSTQPQRRSRARQPPPTGRTTRMTREVAPGEVTPLRLGGPVPPGVMGERLLVRIAEAAAILACERKFLYKLFALEEVETIGHGASRRVVVESLRMYVERELERERERLGRRGA